MFAKKNHSNAIMVCCLEKKKKKSLKLRIVCVLNYLRYIADDKMKVPSVENPELSDVLPLKPGVGQNCCQEFLSCPSFDISGPFTFAFSKSSPYFLTALVVADGVSLVGPRNKIVNHTLLIITNDFSRFSW